MFPTGIKKIADNENAHWDDVKKGKIASSQSVQKKVESSSKSVSPQDALYGHVDEGGGDS